MPPTAGTGEIFYPPPATTGYRPRGSVPPVRPTPPPSGAPPRYWTPPPPRTGGRSGRKSGDGRAVWGCLSILFVLWLLNQILQGCTNFLESVGDSLGEDSYEDSYDSPSPSTTGQPCPERIARQLPGEDAELVEAFLTENKQITLCRTADGDLYYYGEFSDGREPGVPMPATETSDGYDAVNDPYRYVIEDDVVTIFENGRQIGEEDLTPLPDPS